MKNGKWRLEVLPWGKLSSNLSKKRVNGSQLFGMVYTTPGGMVHSSTDLYAGQILWNPASKEAWVDMALQCVDTAKTPDEALSIALECMDLKDFSYVDSRCWMPGGPVTPIERVLTKMTVIHLHKKRR